jgi:Brp/Blh family beta-carotene 15,15'-monooxygenase
VTGTAEILRALPLFAGCAALAVAAQFAVPDAALVLVLLAGIVLGGMPHGGLDLYLARQRFPLHDAASHVAFLAAYLALAGAVVGLWLAVPTLSLLAFLSYSAWHFGGDWAEGPVPRAAAGLSVLALPAMTDPVTVALLFDALAAEGARARDVLRAVGLAALTGALVAFRCSPLRLATLAGLGALAWAVHPLAYFFAYFCGLHGPIHVSRVARRYRLDPAALLSRWIGPALVAGLAVAAAALWIAPRIGWEAAALQASFIGFAALTVPHMLLVDGLAGRRRSQR